ncbi:hypothetical protein F4692_000274 [Nocardioides cavernae]|uniref:Uncharacterized protein n=1 Tax=Nocardioides cavernae TaxID=1921566 RepID=A0A7Y9KQ31_9ACTN|nr:hypothetical protein [Nocardioides cavernae]NYE35170.1 hypothetical protein [Nocardioides cavernae]
MTRLATRILAVLLPAAAIVPASAHAASLTVEDVVGDARAINMGAVFGELVEGQPTEGPFLLDAPAETGSDVVRTTIDHARKRLTVTVQLRDLVAPQETSVDFRILTAKGRYDLSVASFGGEVSAELYPGRGTSAVFADEVTVTSGSGTKPCRTVRARYDGWPTP